IIIEELHKRWAASLAGGRPFCCWGLCLEGGLHRAVDEAEDGRPTDGSVGVVRGWHVKIRLHRSRAAQWDPLLCRSRFADRGKVLLQPAGICPRLALAASCIWIGRMRAFRS